MALSVEVPVFIDTNLGTHIAMAVSPDITAENLKRELRREHSSCFPNLGEIRVSGLMVKRKSCFYHLPDSIQIKNAFQGLKGTWYLRIDATPVNDSDKPYLSEGLVAEFRHSVSNGSNLTDSQKPESQITCTDNNNTQSNVRKRKRKRSICLEGLLEELLTPVYIAKKKKRRRIKEKRFPEEIVDGSEKRCLLATEEGHGISSQGQFSHLDSWKQMDHREEWTSRLTVETPCVSSSKTVSVTGIITRYFPEFDEVKSFDNPSGCDIGDEFGACGTYEGRLGKPSMTEMNDHCSKVLVHGTPQCTTKTPPRMLCLPLPADPSPETSRGKLGRTEVGKRLVLAANDLGISASKKKPTISVYQSKSGNLSSSPVRNLVFEVPDGDD